MSSGEEKEEIEITPEMIEAGLEAYRLYSPSEDSPTEIIKTVYEAMHGQRLRRAP